MGGVPNAPGPSPTLGSLGPSHQWHHKSRASLRGPPCAHGVAGTPQGEVRDKVSPQDVLPKAAKETFECFDVVNIGGKPIVEYELKSEDNKSDAEECECQDELQFSFSNSYLAFLSHNKSFDEM